MDDGSRDAPARLRTGWRPRTRISKWFIIAVNRGYGGAVISGLQAATLPYVLLCDGDGQFDAAEIARLLPLVPRFDVVAGGGQARRSPDAPVNGQAWTALVRLLFGIKISDVDCGFKLFRREFTRDLELNARGAMISTELMVKLARRGARIGEVEVAICRAWRASSRAPTRGDNAGFRRVVPAFWRAARAKPTR